MCSAKVLYQQKKKNDGGFMQKKDDCHEMAQEHYGVALNTRT